MDTIFMNSENSKTSKTHVFILKLTNKLDLRIGEKIIALLNLTIYNMWKNIKNSYDNNKFKISDGLYSVSDYFGYVLTRMIKY